MDSDYSQTYLYKLHKLTNSLDKTFDQTLRRHAGIGLSQFTLLLSVAQHQPATQRTIAEFLDLSAGAISRQVAIAQQNGWIKVADANKDKRAQILSITNKGKTLAETGLQTLERHVFSIFNHSGAHTHLMEHIDLLLGNIGALDSGVSPALAPQGHDLPKAADLFLTNGGDLNRAAIDIQKTVGHHVSPQWWTKNIGDAANDLATAKQFDKAYKHYVQQIAELDK